MFRVHQFNKVEMFVVRASPRTRADEHDRCSRSRRRSSRELGLPYRVVNVAAGDLGASAVKKYDIEAWFPHQQRYREMTSTSNTTDFQARRLGDPLPAGGPEGHRVRAHANGRRSPTASCSRCSRTSWARCRTC